MRLSALCVAAALAIGSIGLANATPVNLIQNGDFSAVTFGSATPAGTEASTINRTVGQTDPRWITVDHWQVSNSGSAQALWYKSVNGALGGPGSPLLADVSAPPGSGSFVALNGDQGAGPNPSLQSAIQQQLTGLTAGDHYVVSFDWAVSQQTGVTGPTSDYLQVFFGGQSHTTDTFSIPTHGFDGWQHVSFGFTADSDSPILRFLAFGMPAGLPPMALLTNVSVHVPEPSDFGLFGLGLLALGGMAIYARRRATRDAADEGNHA